MKKMMTAVLLTASLATLAACGGGNGADKNGDGKITKEEMAAEAGNVQIEAGEWEITNEITSVDMDEAKIPAEARGAADAMTKAMVGKPQVSRTCVTEEQAKKPGADFFQTGDNGDCKYKEFVMSGGTLKLAMTCTGPAEPGMKDRPSADIKMNGKYTANSYDLTATFSSELPQMGTMAFNAKTTGKRIGECPAPKG